MPAMGASIRQLSKRCDPIVNTFFLKVFAALVIGLALSLLLN